MRRMIRLTTILMLLSLCFELWNVTPQVIAETTSSPWLVVSQLKLTSSSGQFVTLYNTTSSTLDMSKYQLQYFNNYDLSKATSSRLISLSGSLPAHSYYMVNDSALTMCYRLNVDSQSLGFSTTAGMLQVLSVMQAGVGAPAVPQVQDYIAWTKTPATGAQALPTNTSALLQRQPVDAGNNPAVTLPGSGSWQVVQPDPNDPCRLITSSGSIVPTPSGLGLLLSSAEPPASIISLTELDASKESAPRLPAADIGLQSPQITELLPNPVGTGNDATDEYIELYNPNDAPFDLTGFSLQTGLSTTRKFGFPSGTLLAGKSFTAFYSEATSLSLSNTSSQAVLLDPFGNTISKSDIYASAKDGVTWALAKGRWHWTIEPTPSAANVIKAPTTAKKTKSSSSKSKSAVKATSKAVTASAFVEEGPSESPIHVMTLAVVVTLTVLYAAYEYRADLANRVRQFGRHLASGRGYWPTLTRRRGD